MKKKPFAEHFFMPVSYTHLDVYKRQLLGLCLYSNQIETIFIIDGLIKMGYGAYMVKTTYKVNSENLS